VGVLVGVLVGIGVEVDVLVGVGVGVSSPVPLSQNLLPVSVFPSSGTSYSIQFAVLAVPPTLVAPTEV